MIAVLLLGLLLVLGAIGLVIYLLFGPDDPEEAAPPPATGTSAPRSPGSTAPPSQGTGGGSEPDTGSGTGSGSSAVQGPDPGGTDDLEATARDYVDAVNDRDEAAATGLTCERANPGTLYSVTEGRNVRLGKVEVLEGTVGTAQVTVGDGETALLLENREDGWCVAI
ncbi:MAG: hypothetical protein GEV28_02730 [Actinophytocola sp.]|uniref:hypothetical protein n=1 Tax=Actinophytocola sp. TaxID=1872138 RepID=UPI0013211B49|nr:hypothetical protein [Actinophytocola sp.]MPZ79351.1 hypothetical protein [Actinophytocola sp.]